MTLLDRVRRTRSPWLAAALALAVSAIVAIVVAGGHVAHLHAAESAALFNEQHVLEGAAGVSGAAPTAAPPEAAAGTAVVAAALLPASPVALAPAVRRAEPRAPPSA